MPKTRTSQTPPAAPPREVTEAPARDVLGAKLRGMFQTVESAPVPDEITRLVEALEKKRKAGGRRGGRAN